MSTAGATLVVLGRVVPVLATLSMRIVEQYGTGVLFRLGRVVVGRREPGLRLIIPMVDRLHRVSLRIVTTLDWGSCDCRPSSSSASTRTPPNRPVTRPDDLVAGGRRVRSSSGPAARQG